MSDAPVMPALPEPVIVAYQTDSTMRTLEVKSYSESQMHAYAREYAARGSQAQAAQVPKAISGKRPDRSITLYNGSTDEPYIDIDGSDLWCNASDFTRDEREKIRWMVEAANAMRTAPQPAAAPVDAPRGWTPMHERPPEPDTECAVILRFTLDGSAFAAVDTWAMQREDPTGMGGPTIATGYGWNDNYESDVIAWTALPPHPPADWDQRLDAALSLPQAAAQAAERPDRE